MSISDEDSNNTIILNREGEQNSFNDTDDFQLSKNDKLYQFPQNYREKRFNSRYTKKVNSNQKTNSTISCNISNVRVPTRTGTLKEKPNNKSHLTENDIKLLNIMNLENDKIKKVKETSITIVRSISATTNSEENWFEIISNWHDYVQNQPLYIRELLRRGLPKEFRSAIWKLMIPDTKKDELLDCYQKLSIQNKESPYERILKVDVERTYPDRQKYNQVNNGQQILHTLLKNYSIYDKEVGYCQGMAFIMGHLIEYLSEQQAFLIFERIMNFHQLRFVFVPKMPLIKLLNYQISCIIKEDHNDLYKHFSEIDLNFLTFTSPWIMTCYALSLPFDTCSRIYDIFLNEGVDILRRIAIALLVMNKSNILKLPLEHVLKYLQTEFLENFCEETLFSTALAYKYNNKQIKKYRLEYEEINAKESIIEATIKKIKDEKKCLEMQNSVLKTENSSLAQIIRSHIQTNTDTNEKKTHFRINSNQIGTNLNFMANGIVDKSNQRLHELVNIKNDRIETLTRELNNSDSGKIKREMEKFKELYEDQKKINAELEQVIHSIENLVKPTRKSNIINYLTFE